jgi:hypothetical protein
MKNIPQLIEWWGISSAHEEYIRSPANTVEWWERQYYQLMKNIQQLIERWRISSAHEEYLTADRIVKNNSA